MSTLLDGLRTRGRAVPARSGPAAVLPSPWTAGALAAAQAAAASLAVIAAPVVATWVVNAAASTGWAQVVRIALGVWLLSQHVGLQVSQGHLGLTPLGLLAVPLLAAWFAGRRLARTLDPRAEKIAAGATRSRPAAPPRTALVSMGLAHGGLGALAALAARMDGLAPVLWQAAVASTLVGAVGGTLGAAAYRFGGARAGLTGLVRRLPQPARRWVAPALAALAVQLAAASAVVVVAIGFGAQRIVAMQQALDGGVLGGAVLTGVQVMLAPNVIVWVAAVLTGTSFAVGAGTSVSLGGSVLGPLPAVPLLAALPDPGPLPPYLLAGLLVPFAAGVAAATLLLRRDPARRLWPLLLDVLAVALICGISLGLVAWAAGGPAGPGRLAQVGAVWAVAGPAFAGQVLAGALAAVGVRRGAPAVADAIARYGPVAFIRPRRGR